MTLEQQDVLSRKENQIATITINRPALMNAVNMDTEHELLEALNRFAGDEDVRVVILEGAGDNFSAGGDLSVFGVDADAGQWLKWLRDVTFKVILTMRTMPQPILCKVRGNAFGFGLSMALSGDFVIASSNAKFCLPFVNIGLTLDGGAGYLLPRLIGLAKARRLAFLGEVIGAREAAEMGLIYKVVDDEALDDEVETLARKIAGKPSSLAVSSIKRALEESFTRPLEDMLEWEASHQAILLKSPEVEQAVQKFMGRRQKS